MKHCTNCKNNFEIRDADRAFYKKIDVPEPTHCPDCREQRRLAFRNERTLYPRKCDLCKKDIISIFSADKPFTVYCNECWWSDKWDPHAFGREIDFSRPFFPQFAELMAKVPRVALYGSNNESSAYVNHCDHAVRSYMSVDTGFSDKIFYSKWIVKCADVADAYSVFSSELCYESQFAINCYNCAYCYSVENCRDSWFLYDCKDCESCFLSSNLRHKKYCFMNEQLTKDAYEAKVVAYVGSFAAVERAKQAYRELVRTRALHKFALMYYSEHSTGDVLNHVKNCHACYQVLESEDSAYCYDAANLKDCYDAYEPAFNCELQYETHACNRSQRTRFTSISYGDYEIDYCDICFDSHNLFGCIGLRKAEHAILNKRYTEEEYRALREKLIEHMKKTGEWGEFFPVPVSPFAYNETIAQDYYPLTREECGAHGWRWQEHLPGMRGKETMKLEDAPDNIKDIGDDITRAILRCTSCGKNYKIIAQEFDLYRRMHVPIPRACPDCRYKDRAVARNPRRLWHRACTCAGAQSESGLYKNSASHFHGSTRCPNEFKTTYAPGRPETVYCEECYQAEVV